MLSDDACDCGCWLYIPPTISKKDLDLVYNERKYNLVSRKDHPFADKNGNVLNHRIVMENYLGRYLFSSEHVYHINHDYKDDRLDNLVLKSSYEPHMTKHILKPGKSLPLPQQQQEEDATTTRSN